MYKSRVFDQKQRNPCLSALYEYLCQPGTARDRSRIVALDFFDSRKVPIIRNIPVGRLRDELSAHPIPQIVTSNGPVLNRKGRLLLVEDISNHTMEELGSHFDIDPFFFASYMHQAWRNTGTQRPSACSLPSQERKQQFLSMEYYRALSFNMQNMVLGSLVQNSNHQREVLIMPSIQGQTVGLSQRCCSVLLISKPGMEWIGIMLVDPAIMDEYNYSPFKIQTPVSSDLHSEPFLGGCEDYIVHPFSYEDANKDPLSTFFTPSRQGMLDLLIHHWTQSAPPTFNITAPSLSSLTFYPLKLVSAEWVNYLSALDLGIHDYECLPRKSTNLLVELEKSNTNLRLLQGWRRLITSTKAKLKRAIRFLTLHSDPSRPDTDWDALLNDYEFLAHEMGDYAERLETMVSMVTSAVALIESRRSLAETANVTRLTVLAMHFVPMSYVATLFSMAEGYRPGDPMFWVYFAVTVPIVLLVGLIAKPPIWGFGV